MLASVSLKTELSVLGSEAGITRGRRIEGAVCAARSHIQGIRLPLARRNAGKQYLFCVIGVKNVGSLKLLRPTEHMLHYGAIMLNENDVVEAVCAYLTAND
jgi:hypothetical protein